MNYRVYIDLKGDDREHTESLADTVSTLSRGMGLALRSEAQRSAGHWPGGCDHFTITERGDLVRLESRWETIEHATLVATSMVDYLNANLWGHHGHLLAVFVVDGYDRGVTYHGEMTSFIALANREN